MYINYAVRGSLIKAIFNPSPI